MKKQFGFIFAALVLAMPMVNLISGCNPQPGPAAISPVGFTANSPIDGIVTVKAAPQSASTNLQQVHLRVLRGDLTIITRSVPWFYNSGFEITLGDKENPVKSGDKIAIGQSEGSTDVTITVP